MEATQSRTDARRHLLDQHGNDWHENRDNDPTFSETLPACLDRRTWELSLTAIRSGQAHGVDPPDTADGSPHGTRSITR